MLAYRHAYAMTHFSTGTARTREPENLTTFQKFSVLLCGVSIPRPQGSVSPTDLGLECEAITIASTNRVNLGAWYCPAARSSAIVILFHGYAGEKTGTLREAR